MNARRGQVALYLVVVLVAITILTLANVGTFLAVRAKNHAMNAVDAAALAAARRQGELLNEIGRLNLRHAEVEFSELAKPPKERDWEGARAVILNILKEQQRIAFLGPIDCLRVANEAAKDNGAKPDAKLTSILQQQISYIYSEYLPNPDRYPPPWPGAWEEYASDLSSIAADGVIALCD